MIDAHKMSRGDVPMTDNHEDMSMEYTSGNTKVRIVDPGEVPKEKVDRILKEAHQIGWSIWCDLSPEKQKELNEKYAKRAD
ncbi:hypothetical protein SAMN05192534_12415 [Alteribacillus persepolensis]|uniref:Uncharacterized protein n=1 Tax=Alteribacillus persepolensis TaxID=568899 RepID=A0A1G8IGR4_9BACI|nr:hypothetical protein [Alteribacillus persepolensis]SDI18083.1 hypothetical protein SAMN05192534_12415 [Alteribacillus persepolensis]